MKLTIATLLLLTISISGSILHAQTPRPRLKGKVVRAESRVCKYAGEIGINVKDHNTRLNVKGQQSATKVEDWYREVDLGTLVDIEFDPGPFHEGDGHSKIRVEQVNSDLPLVKFQKSRDCRILEDVEKRRKQGRAYQGYTGAGAASAGGAKSGSAITLIREPEPEPELAESDFKPLKIDPKLDADLIPSPAVLREELEAAASHARNGEFFDTFQYKFALKSELYRDIPELMKVLSEFRLKAENETLFQPIGKLKPEMFTDVVRRQFETSKDANLDNIRLVVQEENVSEGIRGSATVALLNGPLQDDFRKDMAAYYRSQGPESPIFSNSLIALGRLGEAQDISKLYRYVTDESADNQRLVAMQALALTQLIEGPDSLPGGAKTLASVATGDQDPEVRAFAVQSLRPFVYYQDQVALDALFDGADDQNSAVRAQVALALGVGQVERGKKVRDVLRRLMADSSPEVRRAAYLSLTGKLTSGLGIPLSATTAQ